MQVLVAHASAAVRARVGAALESLDATILEAEDADGVLRACREGQPQVALVEAGLCGREDLALLSAVKGDPDLFRVSVVLLDGDLALDSVLKALERGADDVIVEEPSDVEIVVRVRAAARLAALRQQLLERERGLEELAYSDELTRLYNRRFLARQLDALIRSATRHDRALSLVLVDIDRFKPINDRYGHSRGDEVLTRVAARLQRCLRAEDFAGRWGGEEFLVLLPDVDEEGAQATAEKLRAAIARAPICQLPVTVSAGCATWIPEESADDVLRRADGALYEAKRGGRDQVRVAAAAL